jgi:hypothetical protein
MSSENHVQPLLEAYVAGLLDDAERKAVEAHLSGCPACRDALAEARATDLELSRTLADAVPDDGLEDRLVANLRTRVREAEHAGLRRGGLLGRLAAPVRNPVLFRAASGVAAAIVLAAVGYGVSAGADRQQRSAIGRVSAEAPAVAAGAPRSFSLVPEDLTRRQSTPTVGRSIREADLNADANKSLEKGERLKHAADVSTEGKQTAWFHDLYGRGSAPHDVNDLLKDVPNFDDAPDFNLQSASKSAGWDSARGGSAAGGGGAGVFGAGAKQDAKDLSENVDRSGLSRGTALGERTRETNGPASRFGGWAENAPAQPGMAGMPPTPTTPSSLPPAAVAESPLRLDGTIAKESEQAARADRPADAAKSNSAANEGRSSGPISGPREDPSALPSPAVVAPVGGQVVAEQAKQLEGVKSFESPRLPELKSFKPGEQFTQAEEKGYKRERGEMIRVPAKPSSAAPTAQRAAGADASTSDGPAGPGKSGSAGQADPKPVEPAAPANAEAATPPEAPRTVRRMVIRNGEIAFEVDSFDSAVMQVTKITGEEGGFVSTTSSDKLPNGKVSGSVTVRCPPERLDTLVLKLRGIGDLKTQRIAASDVTKLYTDLESQLRAARAMEERLLVIIKSGGDVKALLEAEKQLGTWREKIERLTGEVNYYNNLVSLSTLTIQLMERDVRSPTAAAETEQISAGIVVEDVEKSRADVLDAIDKAKGRIIQSDLSKKTGDQYLATIVADVPPDAAGPLADRLRQIGKVSRMEANRQTVTQGGAGPIVPGLRVERRETRFQITLYNLAGVAPRQVTNLTLAAADVEAAYRNALQQATSAGGRVMVSKLERPRPEQIAGTVRIHVPAEKADAVLAAIRSGVDVLRMNVAVNPDTENSTDTKWGFEIEIRALADVPARESTTLQVYSGAVVTSFGKLAELAKSLGGKTSVSQLNEQDPANLQGTLEFDVPREKWPAVEAAAREAGLIVSRTNNRSPDTDNTVDSKVRLRVELYDEIRLTAREEVGLRVAAPAVADAFGTLVDAAKAAGARAVASNLNVADKSNPSAMLAFSVTREEAAKFEQAARSAGLVVSRTAARQPDGPTTVDHRVSFSVTIIDEGRLIARETVRTQVATRTVPETHRQLIAAAQKAGAKVVASSLQENDPTQPVGRLAFAVSRESAADFEAAMGKLAMVVLRSSDRQAEQQDVVESKVGYDVTVFAERALTPRESVSMGVIAPSARDRYTKALEAANAADAYVLQSNLIIDNPSQVRGTLSVLIERKRLADFERALTEGSDVFGRTVERAQTPAAVDHLVRVDARLSDADQQPPRENHEVHVQVADVGKVVGDLETLAVTVGGRKLDSQLATAGDGSDSATVVLNVPLSRAREVVAAARGQGRVTHATSTRDDRIPEGALSRARITLRVGTAQTVGADRSLGDTIREGVNSGLTGLVVALKYLIMGLLVVAPALLVVWVVMRLLRGPKAKAESDAADVATPPATGGNA